MSRNSLKSRIVSGSFWAIVGELVAGGARVLSYVVYARLLSPTDFGLIGFALLFINLFPLLIDNSLGLTLMRHEESERRVQSTIFFLNIALGLAAIAFLCLIAPGAADILHDRRVTAILPILSVQLLFNALCSVHIAMARRRFQYRRLVPVRFIATAFSMACGLPLAFLGYAYWALVAASIAAALGQMIAAQLLLPWRPQWQFDGATARSLSAFASWVAVDMGVTWMVMSGGGFFLAFFLGAHELGLFRLSDQVDTYVLGSMLTPLIPVLYAGFCEAADDGDASWRLLERSARSIAPVALTVAGAIIICAHPLEAMIGPKWRGVGNVIALNAIADAISFMSLPAPSLLRARGMAKLVAIMRIATVLGQIAVYSWVARGGLLHFLFGKLALEIAIYVGTFIVLRVSLSRAVFGLIRIQLWQMSVVLACTAIGVAASSRLTGFGEVPALAAGLIAFGLPIAAFIVLTERELIAMLFARLAAAK